ncbi:uncharacterized protein LOC141858633 isoform X2 [Brevipalpus obovatus]|uniref:uncharacterized protein LOC141858633 isoform X2 n=1 Tax=Brevipalpus obovatus TaxID=246614 RepID=UPI003D9FA8F0
MMPVLTSVPFIGIYFILFCLKCSGASESLTSVDQYDASVESNGNGKLALFYPDLKSTDLLVDDLKGIRASDLDKRAPLSPPSRTPFLPYGKRDPVARWNQMLPGWGKRPDLRWNLPMPMWGKRDALAAKQYPLVWGKRAPFRYEPWGKRASSIDDSME